MSEITLTPPTVEEAAFLEAIAHSESKGQYNIRWDGPNSSPKRFDSYDKHPNIRRPAIKPGTISTAAGRYQFVNETWQELRERYPELELNDFSPETQDRAALFYARLAYKEQADIHGEKRSFAEALKSDPSLAFSYLGEIWTSAKGGTEQNKATDAGFKLYESIVNGDAAIDSASAKNGIWDLGSAAWDDKKRASFKRNVLDYEKSRKELEERKESMSEEEYTEEEAILYSNFNEVLQNGHEAKKIIEENAKQEASKPKEKTELDKIREFYSERNKLQERLVKLEKLGPAYKTEFDKTKKELDKTDSQLLFVGQQYAKKRKKEINKLVSNPENDFNPDQLNQELKNLDVFYGYYTEEEIAAQKTAISQSKTGGRYQALELARMLKLNEKKYEERIEVLKNLSELKPEETNVSPEQQRVNDFNRIILMDQQRVSDAGDLGTSSSGSKSRSGQAGNQQKSGDPSDTDKGNLDIDGTERGSTEQIEGLGLETILDQPFVYNPERQNFFESVGGAPAVLGLGMALTAAGEGDQDPGDVEIPRVSEMVINHANTLREISKRGLNPVEEARLRNDIGTAFQSAVKAVQEISGGQMGAALAGVSSANVARNEQLKNKAIIDLDVKRKALADYGQLLTNLDSRNQDAGAREAELNYNMQYNRAVSQGKAIASGVNAMINAQQYAEETGPNSTHDIQKQYMLSKFASLDKDLEIVKQATNVGVDATNQQSTEPQDATNQQSTEPQKDDKDPLAVGSMNTKMQLPRNEPQYFSEAVPVPKRKQVNFGEMMIKAPEAKLKI